MRNTLLGGLIGLALVAWWWLPALHWGEALKPRSFDYPQQSDVTSCWRPDRLAPPATADTRHLRYRVRTPTNYRADHAHPLMLVFSPATLGPAMTEHMMGLTGTATAQGILVAYVETGPLSLARVDQLADLAPQLAGQWCIDASRITLVGHSDGGTVAQVMSMRDTLPGWKPAAVIASAAGLRTDDFESLWCPGRLNVLLLQGSADRHFPDYGESAAVGWARCLKCAGERLDDGQGCVNYPGCQGELRLCTHDGGHRTWPADIANQRITSTSIRPADHR